MALSEELIKLLSKKYESSAMTNIRFKGNDVAFRTDEQGNPVLLFIGKHTDKGNIKGERYIRTLVYDKAGTLIKDHWDNKGKAS